MIPHRSTTVPANRNTLEQLHHAACAIEQGLHREALTQLFGATARIALQATLAEGDARHRLHELAERFMRQAEALRTRIETRAARPALPRLLPPPVPSTLHTPSLGLRDAPATGLSASRTGFQPFRFVQARDLALEVDSLPFCCYALQHAGVAPVQQITVTNQGAEDSQNLQVEVMLIPDDYGNAWTTNIPQLAPGGTWHSGPIKLPLRLERLRAVLEKEHAQLRVTVRDRDEVLATQTADLPLLAYNEWVYLPQFLELAAAFVQPNDSSLHPVVQAAAQHLNQATGSSAFSGYQQQSRTAVMHQLRALHQALIADFPLDYINPPPSFELTGQKVRLVADTLNQRRGTCLDLAVLQAALWEHVGLHPMLVLVPGHALLACWQDPVAQRAPSVTLKAGRGGPEASALEAALNSGALQLFNSVEVASAQSLDDAQAAGNHVVHQALQGKDTVQFIDIAACRAEVTPLP